MFLTSSLSSQLLAVHVVREFMCYSILLISNFDAHLVHTVFLKTLS